MSVDFPLETVKMVVNESEGEAMVVKYIGELNREAEVEREGRGDWEEAEEEEEDWSSDSEIGDALDWLDLKDFDGGGLDGGSITLNARRPNAHGGALSKPNSSKLQPLSNRNQKFTHRICIAPLEELEGRTNVGMSNSVITATRESLRGMAIGKTRNTEKADRATVEQANVYYATKSDGQELAIKVYKTSVLVFKDRDRYVQGDYRFRYGYCKHNPRKMVKTWAEKEMRNLMMYFCQSYSESEIFSVMLALLGCSKAAGLRCPTPILLRLHVLVMEFIGKAGNEALRLKEAALSLDKMRESYVEIITAMRTMYQKCKLVHGDLSEYNILYHEGHLYIIDVSQSVDLDHPHALDFLREDCLHVSDFFKKNGVAVMTIRELFDFIVDPTIADDDVDSYLDEDTGDMYYKTITGLKETFTQSSASKKDQNNGNQEEAGTLPESETGSESDDDDANEDEDGSSSEFDETKKMTPEDRKAARKENKKKVKEEKKEARKNKIPKAMKKRKKKLSKAQKTR
ncbi:Serine/threonine-protein kinase RIO1 [Bienertia sinuspersici]